MKNTLGKKIDRVTTFVPLLIILALFFVFMVYPVQSTNILDAVRNFLGSEFGLYYIILGVGCVVISGLMAFSKYGKVKLGKIDKPAYGNFKWGTMIFTSTMAADILFYSCYEWAAYGGDPYVQHLAGGNAFDLQRWASTFPLFHWGPIAWSFYIVLAVAFGFMLHVRGRRKQKFSEACRPLLGNKVDGPIGKLIDLLAVFALLAGTATTFSLATPLLAEAMGSIFGFTPTAVSAVIILVFIAVVYTITVLMGMKGIARLAGLCVYMFIALLLYVLIGGGETAFILEAGVSGLGNMLQNFVGLATQTDPLRTYGFVQNSTIFYWAYWMAWCVATPFFIGMISKGRTIKNVVLGGYGWGLAGTFTSFIILGNYGMAQQLKHGLDVSGFIRDGGAISTAIIQVFDTLPLPALGLILLFLTMVNFYSTTFDALTMVISTYSYKELAPGEEPDKKIRTFWAVLFILFPIALIFAKNSIDSLQSVAVIAAFPIGIILIIILGSFYKDIRLYMQQEERAGEVRHAAGERTDNASRTTVGGTMTCPAPETAVGHCHRKKEEMTTASDERCF